MEPTTQQYDEEAWEQFCMDLLRNAKEDKRLESDERLVMPEIEEEEK